MRTAILECPSCGAALQIEASQAGVACRCGACGRSFRAPVDLPSAPALLPVHAWRRVRTGLGVTYFGGLCLLLMVLMATGLLVAFCLTAPPELLEELRVHDDLSDTGLLIIMGSCGLSVAALLCCLVICVGCLQCLAIPPINTARGWLAASIANLLVGMVAGTGVLIVAGMGGMQLELQGDLSDSLAGLLVVMLMLSGVLGLLTAITHGGFLRRLASHLGNESAARSAAGYQIFLLLSSFLLALGLCVVAVLIEAGGPAAFTAGLAALLVLALLLGWWLSLIHSVRCSLQFAMRAARPGRPEPPRSPGSPSR